MGLFDFKKALDTLAEAAEKAKDTASQMAQDAADAAGQAKEAASQMAQEAAKNAKSRFDELQDAALTKAAEYKEQAAKLTDDVFESLDKTKEESVTYVAGKLREMVRNQNLQESIDAIENYGRENKKDVSAIANFIKKLKAFGDESE